MRRTVLFHAVTLSAVLVFAGAARAIEQEFLWEGFETKTTWAMESARGPVTIERVEKNATEIGRASCRERV